MAGQPLPRSRTKTLPSPNHKDIFTCTRCGKEYNRQPGNFPFNPSPLYKANNNYCTVCSECMDELFQSYRNAFGSDEDAIDRLCQKFDLYFSPSIVEASARPINKQPRMSLYCSRLSLNQYRDKTYDDYLTEKRVLASFMKNDEDDGKDKGWSRADIRNRKEAVEVVGYDPFEGYSSDNRRFLFGELVKYFDDDIAEDSYKLSQIIQIVNNNNQIRQYDLLIARLDPIKDAKDIGDLQKLKNGLVTSNDKIAKENEISVKNRSNKDVGKTTLTYLMRDLRGKGFKDAEANYYDQLRSTGTIWAIDMSNKAIQQNAMFDENDKAEMFDMQRKMIQELQAKLDDKTEECRLLLVENASLKEEGQPDD